MELPDTVTLHAMPDGYLSKDYALTIGKAYAVRGQMGSCVVIDTDEPGETASVHWSRFARPVEAEGQNRLTWAQEE